MYKAKGDSRLPFLLFPPERMQFVWHFGKIGKIKEQILLVS
jgi:hypothetical protein